MNIFNKRHSYKLRALQKVVNSPITRPLLFALATIAVTVYAVSSTFLGHAQAQETAPLYENSLNWSNWSWGSEINTSATRHSHSEPNSMSVAFTKAWAGLSLHHGGLDVSPYTHLEFYIHPGGREIPAMTVGLQDAGGNVLKRMPVTPYITSEPEGWELVRIPLVALNASERMITRFTLQEAEGAAHPAFYLDDIGFVAHAGAPEPPSTEPIFDGSAHWSDWSWRTSSDSSFTTPVYQGTKSLGVTFSGAWAGLSYYSPGIDTAPFTDLEVAIHGGSVGSAPKLQLLVHGQGGALLKKVSLNAYLVPVGEGWYQASVPLKDLRATNTTITRVTLQEARGISPPTFYLDDFRFI